MGIGFLPNQTGPAALLLDQIALLRRRVESRLMQGLSLRSVSYGLRRDLAVPIEHPSAKIPLSIRPLTQEALEALLPLDTPNLTAAERREITWRRSFGQKVGHGGYVAIDERDGRPCYMQWLLDASHCDVLHRLGSFPVLCADEAILENAYTPPSHRGLGIMSAAMALIAEKGADVGARHVLTFVGTDNAASLKGCKRAGFAPDMLHYREHYLFGTIRRDRFVPLAADDPRRHWQL